MTAAWLIADPASAYRPDVIKLMDRENLVTFAGPGCYKCERPWSAKMAKRRCLGSLDTLAPNLTGGPARPSARVLIWPGTAANPRQDRPVW